MRNALIGLTIVPLAACTGPAISQISDSSLTVQRHWYNGMEGVNAEAARGCRLYDKRPVFVSQTLNGDQYLFACEGANVVKASEPPAPKLLACYLPNGASIQTDADGCLQAGGGTRPMAAPPPVAEQPLGPAAAAGSPPSAPGETTIRVAP